MKYTVIGLQKRILAKSDSLTEREEKHQIYGFYARRMKMSLSLTRSIIFRTRAEHTVFRFVFFFSNKQEKCG